MNVSILIVIVIVIVILIVIVISHLLIFHFVDYSRYKHFRLRMGIVKMNIIAGNYFRIIMARGI